MIVVCLLSVCQVSSWLVVAWVSYMAIYVPIVMFGLRLSVVVLQELPKLLYYSVYGFLSVHQVLSLNSFIRELKIWKVTTRWRIVKMNFYNFNNFPVIRFCWGPPYFDHRYPFVKTDSGLSAYCHGNADFANVWERCWPTTTLPIYTLSPLCDLAGYLQSSCPRLAHTASLHSVIAHSSRRTRIFTGSWLM